MATVKITNVETVKNGVNANLFNPFSDPITLRLTIEFSLSLPEQRLRPVIQVTFQIIELRTNQVFEDWRFQIKPTPAGNYVWIDLPTADDLGLNWTGSDIFGFRGAVELFSNQGARGLKSIDALDVSQVHWFRIEQVFTL
jgi:hypothetical protein